MFGAPKCLYVTIHQTLEIIMKRSYVEKNKENEKTDLHEKNKSSKDWLIK